MAWDDVTAAELAADKGLNTARATAILERSRLALQIPWEEYVTEKSTSSATFVSVATLMINVRPDHVGMYLYCWPQCKVTAAANAEFRLDNTTDSETGTEIAFTNTATYADLSAASKVILASSGTLTFELMLKTDASTAFVDIEDRLCWWFQVD